MRNRTVRPTAATSAHTRSPQGSTLENRLQDRSHATPKTARPSRTLRYDPSCFGLTGASLDRLEQHARHCSSGTAKTPDTPRGAPPVRLRFGSLRARDAAARPGHGTPATDLLCARHEHFGESRSGVIASWTLLQSRRRGTQAWAAAPVGWRLKHKCGEARTGPARWLGVRERKRHWSGRASRVAHVVRKSQHGGNLGSGVVAAHVGSGSPLRRFRHRFGGCIASAAGS